MKRGLLVSLIVALLVFATSCGSNSNSINSSTDEDGNLVLDSDGRRTVMINSLPHDMPYNDLSVSLEGVEVYENEVNYSHTLFIVTTIGVSGLDEESLHWLMESDLNVSAYITCADNDYDFNSATKLGSLLLSDGNLIFVSTSVFGKENRHSFAGSEICVSVSINQEGENAKEECAQYSYSVPDLIPDADEIQQPLNEHIADWLYERADSLKP